MKYSKEEVIQFVAEEDVKFIRMAFCDIYGKQKNISIMPGELERAFEYGIAIDASAIDGFGGEVHSDLFLHPDTSTLCVLPWRPEHGKVVRMFCTVTYPDGTPFEADTRALLRKASEDAEKEGISFAFGSEMEFYLFKCDENGEPTNIPYDNAGYMDVAPEDKGENVRREICLTLERMGINPESSHHEEGPGQNEIDFCYSHAITAADDALTFRSVVLAVAARNGLCADFSPKPIENKAGNGMHINFSAKRADGADIMPHVIAGILAHIREITAFLNITESSYKRFGSNKAPKYISWSGENRSQLIRIPAAQGEYRRAELRSPDPMCNPYLAFTLLIRAGLDGVKNNMVLPVAADINLYTASEEVTAHYEKLPETLEEAKAAAKASAFVAENLPASIIADYTE
ncbi:MAG: glutamine synthetase family protein [Eubacterium sp.]|nr:glutamine synthetase family protein [Eubacterium sp.]CDE18795.1 glutamate--ammonia ligase [Eubacterium sp. CAG:841]